LQNLKRRGISTDIDWTTHEMNMEAAEYAQAMIDRQQNISDSMLAGEFLSSDDPMKQIARKVVLPFASFILNQKARMYNDLNTLFSKTSTNEDRVIASKSLAGLAAELATYQMIGFGIRRLYDMIAASLLGDEDDEETKKKKIINATKYPVKSIVNDIVSPLPMTDGITTWGLNQALAQYPWMSDKEIKDAVESRNKVLELKGEPNMTEAEEKEFIAKIKEEATYQVFDDDFDRSYGMIGIVGSTYQELGEISKLSTTGEFTDEYQGRETTKKLLDSDREKVKYAVPFMIAYSTGLLPKDVGAISRNYVNRIKKKAITEKQYERYDAVQKDLGRNLKSWEIDIVKSKKESETAISEIEFIERNGGLTERQGREYLKLMKAIGEPTISDIVKIKEGQTADQILK
jgi:bacterioferritin (cytochrome b1)